MAEARFGFLALVVVVLAVLYVRDLQGMIEPQAPTSAKESSISVDNTNLNSPETRRPYKHFKIPVLVVEFCSS